MQGLGLQLEDEGAAQGGGAEVGGESRARHADHHQEERAAGRAEQD